jgi:hypothetical protein
VLAEAPSTREYGVALSETAMGGLPAPMVMPAVSNANAHEHVDIHVYDLTLPGRNGTPQALFGRPEAYLPFTSTYLHGSWDGKFIFGESMITRAFYHRPQDRDVAGNVTA